MDDAVRQALARWPDVPDCFGWLHLSRRGEWQLPDGPIRHAGLAAFIGRNYEADSSGRWYFQNGPQRVFVSLAYTPTVVRLAAPARLQTHTGLPVETLSGAWLDDEGSLLLGSEHGIALLDDRDLGAMVSHLIGELEAPDAEICLDWGGLRLPVERIARAAVPTRFGFVSQPA